MTTDILITFKDFDITSKGTMTTTWHFIGFSCLVNPNSQFHVRKRNFKSNFYYIRSDLSLLSLRLFCFYMYIIINTILNKLISRILASNENVFFTAFFVTAIGLKESGLKNITMSLCLASFILLYAILFLSMKLHCCSDAIY